LDRPALLGQILERLAAAVPYTLVLVLDQAEEMFTLEPPAGPGPGAGGAGGEGPDPVPPPEGPGDREQAVRMLSLLAEGRGDYKVIVSLRTEFYGRLVAALRRGRPGTRGTQGVRDYLLTDLDRPALLQVITRPTSPGPIPQAREIPRDKYG